MSANHAKICREKGKERYFDSFYEAKVNDLRFVADNGALLSASLDDPDVVLSDLTTILSLLKF